MTKNFITHYKDNLLFNRSNITLKSMIKPTDWTRPYLVKLFDHVYCIVSFKREN